MIASVLVLAGFVLLHASIVAPTVDRQEEARAWAGGAFLAAIVAGWLG